MFLECKNYDERQIRERGFIFKLAFLLLMVFNVVTAVLSETTTFWNANFSLLESNLVSIMLVVMICSILMMVKNVYIPLNNAHVSKVTVGLFTFASAVGLVDNLIFFNLFNVIIFGCTFVIFFTYLVMLFIESKKSLTDEED